MHWINENKIMMSLIHNNKISFYTINSQTMNIDEKQSPDLEECENFD
jgi:hypothetical protein